MSRPTSVTILALAVLSLAAFHLLGAVSGIQRYAFLSGLPLSLPPAYRIVSSAAWGLLFGALAFGLWRLKQWGRIGTLTAFSLYLAHGWADRFLFGRSDFVRMTVPYALLTNVISLMLVWGTLLRRKVRQSFSA